MSDDNDLGTITVSGDDTVGPTGPNGNSGGAGGNTTQNRESVASIAVYNLRAKLDAATVQLIVSELILNEGLMSRLYFDSKGKPTIGVGKNLVNLSGAFGVPFRKNYHFHAHQDDIDKVVSATHDDIEGAYNYAHSVYTGSGNITQKTNAYLSSGVFVQNDYIGSQLATDISNSVDSLKNVFSDFGSYPRSAKVALVDMNFNLGASKFQEFVKMIAAVKSKNWNEAAVQSHRTGIAEVRNQRTAALFQAAAKGN